MEVMVERNLSSWYKKVPLVSVNVYLRPVEVSWVFIVFIVVFFVIHELLMLVVILTHRYTHNTKTGLIRKYVLPWKVNVSLFPFKWSPR